MNIIGILRNCVPQTILQIANKLAPQRKFPELQQFVNHRETFYEKIQKYQQYGLVLSDEPKLFVLKLLNTRENKHMPLFLRNLQREVFFIQALFNVSNIENIELNPNKKRKHPTFLCRWIDTLEVRILETVIQHLRQKQLTYSKHCIPIHDGLLIDKRNKIGQSELQCISDVVFNETNFRYSYKLKPLKPKNTSVWFEM